MLERTANNEKMTTYFIECGRSKVFQAKEE